MTLKERHNYPYSLFYVPSKLHTDS
jgi:hypothetical protein